METIGTRHDRTAATKLPIVHDKPSCDFTGYDADILMKETAKLRKLITKKGTLEILIPLCCTTNPVRYIKFRHTLKGFSSKTSIGAGMHVILYYNNVINESSDVSHMFVKWAVVWNWNGMELYNGYLYSIPQMTML